MVAPVLENLKLNDEGFMTDPSQWTREVAVEIARLEGIESLTDAHWKIIDFCRKAGEQSGKSPTLRQITDGTGVSTKELFALFPKGPAKKVAKVSGLGKPEGCV
jgi:dissimilatory sulfite reductase related protein